MRPVGDPVQDHDTSRVVEPQHDAVVTPPGGAVAREITGEWCGHPGWVLGEDAGHELDDRGRHPGWQPREVPVEATGGHDPPRTLSAWALRLITTDGHKAGSP